MKVAVLSGKQAGWWGGTLTLLLLIAFGAKILIGRTAEQEVPDGALLDRLPSLTSEQVESLVLLGRTWGFLKYHHPAVLGGDLDWDGQLGRMIVSVLAAPDRDSVQSVLSAWIDSLGDVPDCSPCASVPATQRLSSVPALDWLRDDQLLTLSLRKRLAHVYRNRSRNPRQEFAQRGEFGNVDVTGEKAYGDTPFPNRHLRLLALFRLWNILEYWAAYRDLIPGDRVELLRKYVVELWQVPDADSYARSIMRLFAQLEDGHANLWSSIRARPPVGDARIPAGIRRVGDQYVVTVLVNDSLRSPSELRLGDALLTFDGLPVASLVERMRPFFGASNAAAQARDIALHMTNGGPGPLTIEVVRQGRHVLVSESRREWTGAEWRTFVDRDLPGPAFQRLSEEVVYLKISAASASSLSSYVQQSNGASIWVVDLRGYPMDFAFASAIASRFVDSTRAFALIARPDFANPGAFVWDSAPQRIQPVAPRVEGKLVLLTDESTQSAAEYATMMLRAVPGSIVVGTATAGADGDVVRISLPGGLSGMVSGLVVAYPNKRQTQQIGILPDVVVSPSIAGVRAERDEALEAGVSFAMGHQFRLARHFQDRGRSAATLDCYLAWRC
jgi:C-terminal processing protease CtpA/Prc